LPSCELGAIFSKPLSILNDISDSVGNMKRIIKGRTYNTETSDIVYSDMYAHHFFDIDRNSNFRALLKTRNGAFYLLEKYMPDQEYTRSEEWGIEAVHFEPISEHKALKWLEIEVKSEDLKVKIIERYLGVMPDAGDKGHKLTIRLSKSLKDLIEYKAKVSNKSINSWVVTAINHDLNKDYSDLKKDDQCTPQEPRKVAVDGDELVRELADIYGYDSSFDVSEENWLDTQLPDFNN